MGLFEKIFGRKPEAARNGSSFSLLQGYQPVFRTWSGSVFESELIRAALDAHGRHAAKLAPNITGSAQGTMTGRLKIQPNNYQTWPQFLYREAVILYARNTAFIVPVRGETYGEITGIMGVVPDSWELVESGGHVFIRFIMPDGKRAAELLSNVGILTRYQYKSELFGENNEAMKDTLNLIAIQKQGIEEGIRNGASFRFMAQSDNWSSDEDLAHEMERFNSATFGRKTAGGGTILFPNTYKNIQQLKNDSYKVDADQLKQIKENVYDYFAVNEDIIQNKAFGDNWLAFYEGAVEWLAIQLSEVLSRMLFSENERRRGNRIFFTSNRLQYMSNADKMNAISQMADRGLMTRNELREILNLAPLPEPWGDQIPARGEYYNITDPDNGKTGDGNNDGDEKEEGRGADRRPVTLRKETGGTEDAGEDR